MITTTICGHGAVPLWRTMAVTVAVASLVEVWAAVKELKLSYHNGFRV